MVEINDEKYLEWSLHEATEVDLMLLDRVSDFGELFEDMLFAPGSNTEELLRCQTKAQGSDEWVSEVMSLPDELEYFSYTYFRYKVEDMDCDGCYNPRTYTLSVTPGNLGIDSTILHEMIHLHEELINEYPMYFHDMLLWGLYKNVRDKIPRLDEIIDGHAHMLTGSILYEAGGTHDILFMLKSFDLDMRMGYPLGTVFAYGRLDELAGYLYEK